MIIEMNRTLVANYNTSVQVFNDCINVAGTAVDTNNEYVNF